MSEADPRSALAPVNVHSRHLDWEYEPDWRSGDAEFRRLTKELAKMERNAWKFRGSHPSLEKLRVARDTYQPPDRTCCRPKGKHAPDLGGAPGGGDCQGLEDHGDHLPHEREDYR